MSCLSAGRSLISRTTACQPLRRRCRSPPGSGRRGLRGRRCLGDRGAPPATGLDALHVGWSRLGGQVGSGAGQRSGFWADAPSGSAGGGTGSGAARGEPGGSWPGSGGAGGRAGATARRRRTAAGDGRSSRASSSCRRRPPGAEACRIDRRKAPGRARDGGVGRAAGGEVGEEPLTERRPRPGRGRRAGPGRAPPGGPGADPGRGVAGGERDGEAVDELRIRQTEQVTDGVGLDPSGGRREQLVQDRLGVAHAAGGQAGDHRDGLGVRLAAVGGQDALQLAGDLRDGEAPDIEPLEPRQDRRREVLGVRGGEHERHEVRRLLERLEECVPGVLRDLVRLVEDVDLAAQVRRGVVEALAELAHVVDATVGRGVDLDEVERTALADGIAGRAGVAGVGVRTQVRAVERLGKDPRQGGLARAARPGEQDGVRDLAGRHRVAERGDHRLLADDLGERLGAPAAVEGLVGRPCGQRRSCRRTRRGEVPCTLRRYGRTRAHRRARLGPGRSAAPDDHR